MSEPLEPRVMLTTVISTAGSGDTIFEYSPSPDTVIRIRMTGNMQVEILGASVSGIDNRARIGNLSGELRGPGQPPIDIAGGIGGPGGIDIIGNVISDASGTNPDINAIAADPVSGNLYAFDIVTTPVQNPPPGFPNFVTNVVLIQVTFPATPPAPPYGPGPGNIVTATGTVVADITGALQAAGQFGPVALSVAAADFDPISGLLYFVVRSGTDALDQMFRLNIGNATNSVDLIPGFFQDPGPSGRAVTGLTFDQTSAGSAQLIAAIGDDPGAQGGGQGGGQNQQQPVLAANAGFFIVNPNNTNFLTPIGFFIPGQNQNQTITVGGIETFADDPTRVDSILVVGNNNHWELIRNQPGVPNGLLLDLGPLTEPPPPPGSPPLPAGWVNTAAGTTAITFAPTIFDPFSQRPGAYIGFDAATDRLFFINPFETGNPVAAPSLYQIYVASSDRTARMAISEINLTDPARPMNPFQGAPITTPGGATALRVTNAQTGLDLDVPGQGLGSVFIGALTRNLGDPPDNEDRRPILGALVEPGTSIGLLPVGSLQTDPQTGLPVVPAGIQINGDFDRMLIDGTITGSVSAVPGPPSTAPGTSGSINSFYCAWLITGQANGEIQGAGPTRPQNFRILGDLRNLYVQDSVGTQDLGESDRPNYITGFDLYVGGKLGNLKVGATQPTGPANATSWVGNFHVVNHPDEDTARGIDDPTPEVEWRTATNSTVPAWDAFQFSANPVFFNDTFDTPQYLGAISSLGEKYMVRAVGTLEHTSVNTINDWVDYYGISLMAGQSVTVQLFSQIPGLPYVGVFDPDGREVATDATDVLTVSQYGQPFQVTADRPGTYRFAVSFPLNYAFANAQVDPTLFIAPYELRVTGTGDIAVGGLNILNNMLDLGPPNTISASYNVDFGDLGEIRTGEAMMSIDPSLTSTATVRVSTGNLRSLDGNSIGFGVNNGLNAPVQVDVPAASVGLVRARDLINGVEGILYFNASGSINGRPAIGKDYQVIDGHATTYVELIANRAIGVLRAENMATTAPSILTANADNIGNDGIIDLIDCLGSFGTLAAGGPWISTNTGGNVRYLRVGGPAFTDIEFGGGFGLPINTNYNFGETVDITDDSGSKLQFIPHGVRQFVRTDATGTVTALTISADSLSMRAYAIRGSGGVAVMDVSASDTITIRGTGDRADATGEIGRVIIRSNNPAAGVVLDLSAGGPVFPNPNLVLNGFEPLNPGFGGDLGQGDYRRAPNPFILQPVDNAGDLNNSLIKTDLDVIFEGTSTIDVWDIVAADATANAYSTFDGKLTSVQNNTTNGELVNIRAASIGDIVSRGTIGIARSHSIPSLTLNPLRYYEDFGAGTNEGNFPGTADSLRQLTRGWTNPDTAVSSNLYYSQPMGQFPLVDVRYGVWITGDLDENQGGGAVSSQPGNVRSIRAGQGVGNIIVNGSIGELIANDGGTREDGVFAGVNGIVYARGHAEPGFYNTPGITGRPTYLDPIQDHGGDIWFLDIGEGVAASGSGSAIRAGIYAGRHIDHIVGINADIRGNVIAGDEWEAPRNRIPIIPVSVPGQSPEPQLVNFLPNVLDFEDSIALIELKNGSIINANIGQVGGMYASVEQSLRIQYWEVPDAITEPTFEVGVVTVSGPYSGIIGTSFQGADIGLVDVNDGFGLFSSYFLLAGEGVLGGVEADNYGIRNTLGNVGGKMRFLNARGDGTSVSTARFSSSVRRSEAGYNLLNPDPLTGMPPNALTDIHAWLGTSATTPEIPGRTDTGVMENIDFRGQRDIGSVRAQQIRSTSPDLLPSIINFANTFGSIIVRDQIDGLKITTGKMGSFRPAGDVFNLDLTVAGPLKDLLIKGDLAGSSVIRTQGPVGNMGNIRINGRLDGDILASGKIKRLFVGESISGNIAAARAGKGNAVGSLIIGGTISQGGLNIQGNMGRIVIAGDFGQTGTTFTVTGKLAKLQIKGNLYSNIHVGTVLNKLMVGGSIITGATIEAQRIGSVRVGGDVQPGVIFRSRKAPKIKTGGQMLGDVEILP